LTELFSSLTSLPKRGILSEGGNNMTIEPVKNIVPHILKWAETQTPKTDIYWDFSSGDDEWFPLIPQPQF